MGSAPAPPGPATRGRSAARVRRSVLGALVLLLAVTPLRAQREESLRVVPLVRDHQVLVTLELTDGMTDEVWAAIRSGLRTTFTYSVELRQDVRAWRDRTIETATVATSIEYDNLTRTHRGNRLIDGREAGSLSTEDEDAVRDWMTSLTRVPLFDTAQLQPNREYYIRVSTSARPTGGSILGWLGSGPSGQAHFTFIP